VLDGGQYRTMATIVDGHIKATFDDGLVPDSVEDLHYSEDGLQVERVTPYLSIYWYVWPLFEGRFIEPFPRRERTPGCTPYSSPLMCLIGCINAEM
jgi:hypothetical protein